MFSLSDSEFSPPVTERRLVYVGTTKMRREHTDVGCGPDGTLGVAEIPAGAVVVGSYVAAGSHYVEWVADVDLTAARCCCPGTPTGGLKDG